MLPHMGRLGSLGVVSGAGASVSYPLDQISTVPVGAWSSTWRLREAYTGPACELTRDSDSATSDFTPESNGYVSTSEINTWAGGTAGYSVIYDQMSAGNDWAQSTRASMPDIESSWSPFLVADYSTDFLTNDAIATYPAGDDEPYTIVIVSQHQTGAAADAMFGFGGAGANEAIFLETHNSGWRYFKRDDAGTSVDNKNGADDAVKHVHIIRQNATTYDHWLDGVEITSGVSVPTGQTTLTTGRWGARIFAGSTSDYWLGWMPTMILFDSAISDADIGALNTALTAQQLV